MRLFVVFPMMAMMASLLVTTPVASALAETLTWEDCLREAARANPELKAASENLRSARFQKNGAFAGFLPQISGSGSYSHSNRSGTSVGTLGGTPLVTTSTGRDLYALSANAQQNLFSGFRDVARVKEGKANEDIARADLRATKARISFDLKSAFSDLRYAQDSLKLTRDILKRRGDNRNLVQLRFESGRENKGSLSLSNAYWQQAKFDYLQASHGLETARTQLARVLGRPQTSEIQVAGSIPLSIPQEVRDMDALAAETPDYQRAVGQKNVAKAGVTSSWANFFPSLDATASAGRQDDRWFPEQNRWTVGGSVTIPFFNGGQHYFNLRSAKAKALASEYERQNASHTVKTTLTRSYRDFVEAVQKLETDRAFLEAATIRAEIARSKYDNGLISFEDWDIIENDLISRQKTFLQSERARVTSEASWEQSQGKGAIP